MIAPTSSCLAISHPLVALRAELERVPALMASCRAAPKFGGRALASANAAMYVGLLAARHADRRAADLVSLQIGLGEGGLHRRQLTGGHRHAVHQVHVGRRSLVREQVACAEQHDRRQQAGRQTRARRHRPVQVDTVASMPD